MRRVLGLLGGVNHAGLVGGFAALALGARVAGLGPAHLGHFLAGWGLGVLVLLLIRCFRIAAWGAPVAGLVCGPAPLVLLFGRDSTPEDWARIGLAGALVGLLIGLVELAHQQRPRAGR